MGISEGNWTAEVKWEKRDGQLISGGNYEDDGMLHVCPYSDGEPIQGQHFDPNRKSYPLANPTCVQAGEGRFEIKFEWTADPADGGKTYTYEGNGRLMNVANGPSFIYGTVTANGGADSGTWEAIRVGPSSGPGPGEGPEVGTSG
jgi:hypothetical protein